MQNFYEVLIRHLGLSTDNSKIIAFFFSLLTTFIVALIAFYICHFIEKRYLKKLVVKSKTKWDDYMVQRGLFKYINILAPLVVFQTFLPQLNFYESVIEKFIKIGTVVVFVLIINSFFSVCNDIYSNYKISKTRPIKSYLQVASLTITVIAIIISIGIFFDKSPLGILSGIGAMTAVIMLIFKDSILGFVASIQLAANNMVSIGDWIEMPGQMADGDVIEINLTNVKVQNWDKTITTIPSYALVSNSFRNWKGMTESGGRRIKRSLYIDSSSIRFLTTDEIDKFKNIDILRDYIDNKEKEIFEYNSKNNFSASPLNGRALTNIGTFRAYINNYLKNSINIAQNKTILVRQKEAGSQGIPLEIYCFSNNTAWIDYEGVQSDLFDHFFSIIHEFDLDLFQNPTGKDFKKFNR